MQKSGNAYKNYKILFEQIKRRAKKLYFSNLIIKYKNNKNNKKNNMVCYKRSYRQKFFSAAKVPKED